MALIECPQCGKQISDKASICPSCGYEREIIEKHEEQLICSECGNVLSESDTICPNCGCPVSKETSLTEDIQKVELTSIRIPKVGKKQRTIIIIAIIIVALIVVGTAVGVYINKKNTSAKYKENLSLATSTMLSGAAEAESSIDLIHDVWYNTIYEKSDSETDKFTKNQYGSKKFNSNFNTSLRALMLDTDFMQDIASIKANQDLVNSIMSELVNPPDEYKEAYDKLQELYDSYLELTNLATSPTGSLTSYTSSYNSADTAVLNAYKAMQRYIE